MFRRHFLKKHLTKIVKQLIKQYGFHDYYSRGQIETTLRTMKEKKDEEYAMQLFLDPREYSNSQKEDFRLRRRSLYKYLNNEIAEIEIENNKYSKILDLSEINRIPGDHTPIDQNPNVWAG
jgi:hypothetical protein